MQHWNKGKSTQIEVETTTARGAWRGTWYTGGAQGPRPRTFRAAQLTQLKGALKTTISDV